MGSQYKKYHKIENFTFEQEQKLLDEGKSVRNYGRLDRQSIEQLMEQDLWDDGRRIDLLQRERPWRMKRFVTDLLQDLHSLPVELEEGLIDSYGGGAVSGNSQYGYVSAGDYEVRVVDGGIAEALGKGKLQVKGVTESEREVVNVDDDDDDISLPQVSALKEANLKQFNSELGFKPWDDLMNEGYWNGFELWKELLNSVLINVLPDRPFTLFIFAKDAVGDDVPIYYLELGIKGEIDRHVVVWEMDQVLTELKKGARPHEGSKLSDYASAYQKVYFFINWDEKEPRRVTKLVVSDLAKSDYHDWTEWLQNMHESSWFDALAAIVITILGTALAIIWNDNSVALVAGIIVSGVAAEEWIPPQTIILGAVARFYAHESLALRVYYRTTNSITIRRVLITFFATLPEAAEILSDKIEESDSLFFNNPYGLEGKQFVLLACTLVNTICLFQTLYSGVFGSFSHSDFPRISFSPSPQCYVSPNASLLSRTLEDCRPVEEFCSVFRPILHWQIPVDHRFLGDKIDLGSPGSPPSMACYWFSFPASSVFQTQYVYGNIFWWLFPVILLEQFIAILGALLVIIIDIPVVLALIVISFLRKTDCFGRSFIRSLTSLALSLYLPCDFVLWLLNGFFHMPIAAFLGAQGLECRQRSTARLYRLPLIKTVRTGRTSNHSWKFGDYIYDNAYYRCSDMVIVNPRAAKLGMMEANRLFYKRHKLIWTEKNGQRFVTPILACGDNTISRTTSTPGEKPNILNRLLGAVRKPSTTKRQARQGSLQEEEGDIEEDMEQQRQTVYEEEKVYEDEDL